MKARLYGKDYHQPRSNKKVETFAAYLRFISESNVRLEGKRVLDVGCATGNFLSALGPNVRKFGCDVSEYALAECAKKVPEARLFLFDVEAGRAEALGETEFDAIFCFDVVEHLSNFETFREILSTRLPKGGLLVLTTPNANSVLRKHRKYSGEADPTHKMLFTPYTLDFFLRRSGMRKIRLCTPYSFYFRDDFVTRNLPF